MKTKVEYIEMLDLKSKDAGTHIDLLSAKMEKSSGELKLQYVSKLKGLQAIQYEVREKIKEIEEARGKKWRMDLVIATRAWDALSIGKVIRKIE